ncbi:hypothetical protein NIES2135_34400 [Leptolyngbya boryana NIES-2135]|jgi:hypothetical protein|uniref:Uncharacterized protein n=1 Tax=Leptolyngbya boryana NIES-2135 TaxID=1973484 RepID=A0A1Z4JIS3_LEPBY|nr:MULTISPECIES: hypothetical protein [Leptolyngbya]BAY56606.1 hypothetical protein NIES2135_34400 [Leptolyngbya boryana NIES-2135]MBD2369908.1 hypothetical protein [Leptolyngbya sp. FACHB-161]MBD2376147.1 hypothetical protein [Leptolyngbya sp. FACHB-238]MBD2400422.1 hypothetical protein [Leptolyngbya sp. FACHB-239]MBD2406964.1 hypothetical protein [Leptolyngbya sp. FACHB-402]
MQVAAYFVSENDLFCQIGVEFSARSRSGNSHNFFWVPPYKENPECLFKWVPMYGRLIRTGVWKELSIESALPSKRRIQVKEFWQAQEDVGLWIAHSKQLTNLNVNLRTSA